MALIYSRASFLVIWFGLATKYSETLFKDLSGWADARHFKPDVLEALECIGGLPDPVVDNIKAFLMNPWFKRVWVRQEYILGAREVQEEPEKVQPILACYGTARLRDLLPHLAILIAEYGDKIDYEPNERLSFATAMMCMIRLNASRARYLFSAMDSFSNLSEGDILLKLVAETRAGESTDPRDMVYSTLGLIDAHFGQLGGTPKYHSLIVDYEASVEDVYSSFVKEVVTTTKRLNIFAFWTPRSEYVNRTWTPNWSYRSPYPTSTLLADEILGSGLNHKPSVDANLGAFATVVFANNLSTMRVSGFIWDVVFSEPLPIMDAPDIKILQNYRRDFLISLYGSNRPSFAHMDRSLLACLIGRTNFNEENLRSYRLWIGLDHIEVSIARLVVDTSIPTGLVADEPIIETKDSIVFSPENFQPEHGDTITLLSEQNNTARPIHNKARPGDLICVLLGCAAPMLLRPVEGHFDLLGEVYVPGIMHGEAMAALHEGKKTLQNFELH